MIIARNDFSSTSRGHISRQGHNTCITKQRKAGTMRLQASLQLSMNAANMLISFSSAKRRALNYMMLPSSDHDV